KSPERDLKWASSTTNPNVACDRMNIDGVPTYADRIHEMCRTRPRLMLGRHLLFRDCLDGTDSPAFPNIRMLRQSALLPIMSGRNISSGAPTRLLPAGAWVCSQYRNPRLTRLASCRVAATLAADRSMRPPSR